MSSKVTFAWSSTVWTASTSTPTSTSSRWKARSRTSCATTSAIRCPPRRCSRRSATGSGRRFGLSQKDNDVPVLHLAAPDRTRWDDRKLDHVKPYLDRAAREGRSGVVAIVAVQELAWGWSGKKLDPKPGQSRFAFVKTRRQCTTYYFYVLDGDFGPGFIKIISYFPYPAKVWLNGHEWVKRQADRAGLRFSVLANGFAACDEPRRLQAIADRLGPSDIQAFFEHWMTVIPTPLTTADREAGFWWELSMRQVETSDRKSTR